MRAEIGVHIRLRAATGEVLLNDVVLGHGLAEPFLEQALQTAQLRARPARPSGSRPRPPSGAAAA